MYILARRASQLESLLTLALLSGVSQVSDSRLTAHRGVCQQNPELLPGSKARLEAGTSTSYSR